MMKRALLVLFFIPFFTSPVKSDPQTIYWGRTDFPPFTIIRGEDAAKGVTDRMIDFYIERLPQYNHVALTGSLQRVLAMMRNGEHICHGSLLWKAERTAFVDYLDPNMAQYANGLIVARDRLDLFDPYRDEFGNVDFEALLKADNLRIRYHVERSYSPVIDRLLAQYGPKSLSLIRKSGMKETDKEIAMLLDERLDAVLGRPEEGLFGAQGHEKSDNVTFLKIKGDKTYRLAQIGCAKGAWNKSLMKDINALTLQYRTSPDFVGFYTDWLPENLKADYPQLLDQAFAE